LSLGERAKVPAATSYGAKTAPFFILIKRGHFKEADGKNKKWFSFIYHQNGPQNGKPKLQNGKPNPPQNGKPKPKPPKPHPHQALADATESAVAKAAVPTTTIFLSISNCTSNIELTNTKLSIFSAF
jgi:hypothetical protein